MGQSHSQPSQARDLPTPTQHGDGGAVVGLNRNLPTATTPRRRTNTDASSTARKRMSAFLRGGSGGGIHKRAQSTVVGPVVEEAQLPSSAATATPPPTIATSSPSASGPSVSRDIPTVSANKVAVPPLSVKSRSLRKLFKRGSWAPSPTSPSPTTNNNTNTNGVSQHDLPISSIPMPSGPADELSQEPTAVAASAESQPSLASGSSPRNSNAAADEPSPVTSDKSLTIREIAMLSGSGTPRQELPTPVIAPISLDEDPGAIRLSRSVSFRSLVHQHSLDGFQPDGVPEEVDMPIDVATPIVTPLPTGDVEIPLAGDLNFVPPQPSMNAGTHFNIPPSPELRFSRPSAPHPPMPPHHHHHPAHIPHPATIPSPLPVIPAGTTMIIQGVVQAAEERTPNRRTPNATSGANPNADSDGSSAPNAHAHLDGTFGGEEADNTGNGQDPDSPSGAAELLGALLIAAASATANMLLSDPPGSQPPQSEQPPSYSNTDSSHPLDTLPAFGRNGSSVGIGPRPRPRTLMDDQFGMAGDRTSRPRSMINALRDRMFGAGSGNGNVSNTNNRPEEEDLYERILRSLSSNTAAGADGEGSRSTDISSNSRRLDEDENGHGHADQQQQRDPIESLRERIASELMRALAARDGTASPSTGEENGGGSGSVRLPSPGESASSSPPDFRSLSRPTIPSPLHSGPVDHIARLPFTGPLPPTGAVTLPLEGTFERFLHDTNAELRSTLLERMSNRENVAVPIPASAFEQQQQQQETSSAGAEDGGTDGSMRLVHRAPEGVIEPRLNWWRMHRFPARAVASPPGSSDASDRSTVPPSPTSSGMPPSSTFSTSSPSNFATASATSSSSNPPGQTTLIPVIVVGIRTAPSVLVQEIGALASAAAASAPPSPPMQEEPISRRYGRRRSSVTRPSSSDGSETPTRPTWSRAVDSLTRAIAARRRTSSSRGGSTLDSPIVSPAADGGETAVTAATVAESDEVDSNDGGTLSNGSSGQSRDRTRNYLIWVIGGYYPETHPILTTPNLLLNQIDQDDFWGLAELLGQVKPPVASKDDIDRAGLEIVKADKLADYEKEGRVTSNTSERCLICLGDYEPEEDLRIMSCKHVFHQECVDKWLEVGRNNCPACRTKGVDVNDSLPATSENPVVSSSS